VADYLRELPGIGLRHVSVSVNRTAGLGYELDVIAAAVIGGISLIRRSGDYHGRYDWRCAHGDIAKRTRPLKRIGIWQQVAIGLVIVLAVVMESKIEKMRLLAGCA